MVETPSVNKRTSNSCIPEMLVRAFRVVASATRRFILAEWLHRVYLVTISQGQKTPEHFLCVVGVIAIRLEHAKRALVRLECNLLILFLNLGYLLYLSKVL